MTQERADALIVGDQPENLTNQAVIVELAQEARLLAMYTYREHVESGGLIAYAFDVPEIIRHSAQQIDQVLKGAKPGNIPFYQATKFDLVINLKTAKALGLTIPPSLLARADEVIE
jgi:putative ABC transport system substrate-binding protein